MKRILLACMLASGTLSAQKRLAHCHARDVTLRELDAGVANGGQLHYSFILTNHGNSACSVSGYPSATAFDAGESSSPESPSHRRQLLLPALNISGGARLN